VAGEPGVPGNPLRGAVGEFLSNDGAIATTTMLTVVSGRNYTLPVAPRGTVKIIASEAPNVYSSFSGKLINNRVEDIFVLGGRVFIVGSFTEIDDSPVNGIGMYDGSNWIPLRDPGSTQTVSTIAALSNERLFVGGNFTSIAINSVTVSANRIAWIDLTNLGTASWNAIGTGINNPVLRLVVKPSTDIVFAVGSFTQAFGVSQTRVTSLDGGSTPPAAVLLPTSSALSSCNDVAFLSNGSPIVVGRVNFPSRLACMTLSPDSLSWIEFQGGMATVQ
jgi:hypothetical protein